MNDRAAQSPFIGITIEALLRPCEIYPVRVPFGHGYVWEWAAADRNAKSDRTFDLFYDCLDDARLHGYEPHFMDEHATDIAVVPVAASAA
jgi:hypothetical protein